ncbi:hypothetical protein HanIR_Chr04g0168151 [Helianthus annuus]|nr:hypothetical protein HanIR_Chr04g0168151 [Helianthus annuus]
MSFDLDEEFVFNESLARALVEHQSPIRPLPEHFLWLGRVSFSWAQGDRDWPIIRRKRDRKLRLFTSPSAPLLICFVNSFFFFGNAGATISLLDALKVPNMDVFDLDFEEQGEEDVPLMKQVVSSAPPIRPLTDPNVTMTSAVEETSSAPRSCHTPISTCHRWARWGSIVTWLAT